MIPAGCPYGDVIAACQDALAAAWNASTQHDTSRPQLNGLNLMQVEDAINRAWAAVRVGYLACDDALEEIEGPF